jgi:Fe(3+) dicitrate transport protein
MIRNTKNEMKPRSFSRPAPIIFAVTCFCVTFSQAQDALQTLAPMTVLGSREEVFYQTGSAAFIPAEEIRAANTSNVNEVLAKVPGVYTREEDGFGNFPNISLRGADGTRSEKVTVMEDGILTAPAPYSGPAAYYTPRIARMEGVEILKGSSQVRYGPQTTGGVINYLSTGIPDSQTFYTKATYGSYNTFFGHAYYGDTVETDAGRFGYLLEMHGGFSDGFRDIDGSGQNTGFSLIEPMLKLSFEPNTALKQRIEFKAGYTSFDADETYAGLTDADLARNPDRRYAATIHDNIESEHYRTYLKWIGEPSEALRLESSVYYGYFKRNWYKLDKVGGARIHEVLAPGNPFPTQLGILQGTTAGSIDVKANNRSYESYGWQNQANFRFDTGMFSHDLAVGLRFHYDHQERNHWLDKYNGDGLGNFNFASRTREGQDNRLEEVFATAIYIEDEIKTGNLTLRPGIRYEWLELDDRKTTNALAGPPAVPASTVFQSGNENLLMGGMSANYQLDDSNSVFGGVYRGSSSPGAGDYFAGVEEEESTGYELGFRHRRDELNVELVGFFTDFDNLISTDAGLGGGAPRNAGAAEVAGLESIVQYDAGRASGLSYGVPLYVSATWTRAEFKDTTAALVGGGDDIYAGGRDGNEIPYVPEWKVASGIGIDFEKWGANLDAVYSGTTWGTGFNDDVRPGTQTSRDGKIDALLTFNFSAYYQLNDQVKLLAGVQNLFDERGVVSRIPEGPRANAPRMIYAGFETQF